MSNVEPGAGRPLRPIVSRAASIAAIRPFGLEMRVLARTEDTGGSLSALLVVHQPGEGPPLHMHDEQQEVFFVIEGEYTLTVDGETQLVGTGTMVILPARCVHGFKNTGKVPATMLDCSLPGGQDHMFSELHEIASRLDPKELGFKDVVMQQTAEVNRKYKTTYFPT